jgi:peptide/nickel transport system permease protein
MNDISHGGPSPPVDPAQSHLRTAEEILVEASPRSRAASFFDSDLLHSFLRSKLVIVAALVTLALVTAALLAPVIAPHNPYDLKSVSLLDSNTPPAWEKGGDPNFPLGTDDLGRDILSTILYGTRSSILIGLCSVLLAIGIGLSLGLWAGYAGGRIDSAIMRIADVQLTFPAIPPPS